MALNLLVHFLQKAVFGSWLDDSFNFTGKAINANLASFSEGFHPGLLGFNCQLLDTTFEGISSRFLYLNCQLPIQHQFGMDFIQVSMALYKIP